MLLSYYVSQRMILIHPISFISHFSIIIWWCIFIKGKQVYINAKLSLHFYQRQKIAQAQGVDKSKNDSNVVERGKVKS